MPKKVIVTQVASQEPEATMKATQEAATASPPAPAEPKKVVEEKVVPPKATSSAPAIEKPKEAKPAAGPISPKKATAEPKSQKGKQNSPQKPTSTDNNTVEPISPLPLPPPPSQVITSQTRPQKAGDQSPPKPTSKRTHKSVEQKAEEEEKTPEKKSKEPEMAKSEMQDPSDKKMEKREGPEGYAPGGYREKAESSGAKRSKEVRDMGASAKEVLGKLAKRVKEDENSKQLIINAGVAAVVIVALGAYIAYTIGSGETKN